ncbi:MAG: glycosyltransferase [Bacteroidales bacterium]
MNSPAKNIIISPLEWGLGHAGRMIPVAIRLKSMGHNVFIASGKEHIAFFSKETTGLNYIELPGFTIRYSRIFPQYLVILARVPFLAWYMIREHFILRRLIREYSIDIVISDSRPGLWNSKIKSVFVSHIPGIPLPRWLWPVQMAGRLLGRMVLSKYNFFFIPDTDKDACLSGTLSHGFRLPSNARFIGILSRFRKEMIDHLPVVVPSTCVVILSGPEPQRTCLMEQLAKVLDDSGYQITMLGASPGITKDIRLGKNIRFVNHLPTDEMMKLVLSSETVITRSGYTTVMELASLDKSAILIPTPGQSEQEYLGKWLTEKGWFVNLNQGKIKNLKLPSVLPSLQFEEMRKRSAYLLEKALNELLEQ